jgi:hypothetical protein
MEIANQKTSRRGKDETVPFGMNSVMGGIPDLGYCASCACDIVSENSSRGRDGKTYIDMLAELLIRHLLGVFLSSSSCPIFVEFFLDSLLIHLYSTLLRAGV